MKKITVFLLIAVFAFMPVSAKTVKQEDKTLEETIRDELKTFDFSDLEELRKPFANEDLLGKKTVKEIVYSLANGENSVSVERITDYVLVKLLQGIKESLVSGALILFTVVMCGVLNNMAGESLGSINEICEYVGFVTVVSILFTTLTNYIALTEEMLLFMQAFVRAVFPLLLTLMTAVGSVASVGVFRPAMAVLSGSMVELLENGVMPVCVLGGITGVLCGVSNKINLEKVSEFCASVCKWLMGIGFTVYAGILSIQGVMSATYDGVYIRTAKYTVDAFMPVVGGMMSDTVDTVLGCSLLLKNAIGFTGVLVLASACVLPLIRYASCILSYKLLGAIITTVSDTKISLAINGLVTAVKTMLAICCVAMAMTFITVALAISSGNTNFMLR